MLFAAIKNTPVLRPNAIPFTKNLGIVCFYSAFPEIADVLLAGAQAIFIIDAKQEQFPAMNEAIQQRANRKIAVLPYTDIASHLDLIFVFYHHKVEYHPLALHYKYMRNVGYESYFTFMQIPSVKEGITFVYDPLYYEANKENLEATYTMLADEESKRIFAARIRAITSGTMGYLRLSEYEDYFHPLVKPESGDVILDGGVSEYVASQLAFLKSIGPKGKWFGFEPDPVGFNRASERIKQSAPYDNYELVPFGLWHKRDTLHFQLLDLGTHFTETKSQNTVDCEVVSIDEFVKNRQPRKVDFIKLDVEGAEINALKGAVQTITKFQPKLAISIYHSLQDLYFIPLFLKEICENYEFYIGHHHASLHETVLYAKLKSL
jgi:FkbM family methyltransferase